MVALIIMIVMLIGMMCIIAHKLATYALPLTVILAAARFAHGTGSGIIGAGLVGLVAGATSFGILAFLFSALRSPVLRIVVALIFAAPAAIAGYALVYGVTGETISSAIWRQIFCLADGVFVSTTAVMRLAGPQR